MASPSPDKLHRVITCCTHGRSQPLSISEVFIGSLQGWFQTMCRTQMALSLPWAGDPASGVGLLTFTDGVSVCFESITLSLVKLVPPSLELDVGYRRALIYHTM